MGIYLSKLTAPVAREGYTVKTISPDVEASLSGLVEAACKLVVEHDVKHSTIHKRITEAVSKAAENLPQLQVLYCSQHGGFGYSKAFEAFAESYPRPAVQYRTQCCDYDVSRIENVPVIAAFGKHICENWPVVGDMMYAYFYHGFKMRDGSPIYHYYSVLENLHQTKTGVAAYKTRLATVKEVVSSGLHGTKSLDTKDVENGTWSYSQPDLFTMQHVSQLDTASQSALVQAVKIRIAKLEAAFQQRRVKLERKMAEPALLDVMIEHVKYMWPEEEAEQQKPVYERKKWAERPLEMQSMGGGTHFEFLKAIEHYGATQFAIWHCQSKVDTKVMRFLLTHESARQIVVRDPETLSKAHLCLGLIATGAGYCNLSLATVPQMVEWYISEYDGLETVKIK